MIVSSLNSNIYSIYPQKAQIGKACEVSTLKHTSSLPNNSMPINPSVLRNIISKQRTNLLTPVQSKEEYLKILDEIRGYTYHAYGKERQYYDESGYEKANEDMKALALYCGLNDRSYIINSWLSGRSKGYYRTLGDEKISKSIKAFEYSLKKLDKKFGRFEGKVFRNGYFNPNSDRQYYSSSDRFESAKSFSHHADAVKFKPYSIIKVKNGHKIYKFQEETGSPMSLKFFEREHEVLIDRKSKFRKISKEDYSQEDIKDIKMVLKKAFHIKPWQMNLKKIDDKYNLDSMITVWEEI